MSDDVGIRWRNYHEWRAYAISYLANLQVPPEAAQSKDRLLFMFRYATIPDARDMSIIELMIHDFLQKYQIDLSAIMPTPRELVQFFKAVK